MKLTIWILSIALIALAVLAYMQWRTIQKLTPSGNREADERSTTFGEMVSAFQKEAKEININATF